MYPYLNVYDNYTPYCYSNDNPIKFLDPNGKYVREGYNFVRSDWSEGFSYCLDYIPVVNYVSQGLRSIRNDPSLGIPSAFDYLWSTLGARSVGEFAKFIIDVGSTPLTIKQMTEANNAMELERRIFEELLNTKSPDGNLIVKIGENDHQITPTQGYAAGMGWTLSQAADNIEKRITDLWKKYDPELFEKLYGKSSSTIKSVQDSFFAPVSTATKQNVNILYTQTYLKPSYDASSQ